MDAREELQSLRRLAELEQKAGGPKVDRAAIQSDMQRMADPTSGMSLTDKFNAGMGKAFTDIGRGAAQLVNAGPTGQEVAEQKKLDAPLMNTGAGFAGNIAGNVASIAPAALLPGAATIPAAGALGAATAALQPTESTGERLMNMGKGGALAAGTQFAGTTGAQYLGQRQAAQEAAKKSAELRNAVRDQTLKEAQAAGMVVPPSSVNPSWINRRLEGIGGKAPVGQEASIRNQKVADALARKAAGLGPDDALSDLNLNNARETASLPYREAAALSPQSKAELEAWKSANEDARLAWHEYSRQGTRSALKDARTAQLDAANRLNNIEQITQLIGGRPDLAAALKGARVQIAKIHNVEDAANVGTGSIDPAVLGRALAGGAPLSGELKTIAKFQQAFPQYAREASRIGTPGVSATEAMGGAALGMGGAAMAGNPVGMVAGGLPLLREPVRSLLFSKPYQSMMAQPSYSAPFLTGPGKMMTLPEPERAALVRALSLSSAVNQ